jgi:hypothetical protein
VGDPGLGERLGLAGPGDDEADDHRHEGDADDGDEQDEQGYR